MTDVRTKILIFVVAFASATAFAQAPPAASADYSGMYSFLKDGEFVQLNLEGHDKVTGFVSRYGDLESDRGTFLDHFFKKASLSGNRIQFTTEQVHGVWFDFKGTLQLGSGKTPDDEDHYEMKGTLTEYTLDQDKKESARSRDVTFKSFPRDVATGKSR
ncbi:MAG TPA: hypothetical protein VE994_04820 [Terriglobales bacterium]|nr:hypothetical protein [Terriglobales bacterium]